MNHLRRGAAITRHALAIVVAWAQMLPGLPPMRGVRAESTEAAYYIYGKTGLPGTHPTSAIATDYIETGVQPAAEVRDDPPRPSQSAGPQLAPLPPPPQSPAAAAPPYESVPPPPFDVNGSPNVPPDLRELIIDYASQNDRDMRDGATISDGAVDDGAGADNGGGEDSSQPRRQGGGSRFDENTVRQGQSFFEESCTLCHDAERATSKQKTYAAWLATVRRMAAQEDADIPANQHVPIATYLASLNPAYQQDAGDEAGDDAEGESVADSAALDAEVAAAAAPPFTLNGTISPVYRGTDPAVENKGFFPDVWVNLEWRPENNPLSGRVMTCTSCHGTNSGLGVELVEASFTVDLCYLFCRCPPEKRTHQKLAAELTAGRFVVPFGAFSGRVHPGALRAVSLPLMYNMGRRVGPTSPLQPVINLPYSDEGVNLHLRRDICHDLSVTLDTYAVNGLQQGGGGVFFASRSYRDNNSNVAVGGRTTIGGKRLRFGGSLSTGELQTEVSGFIPPTQNYKLAGGDVSYRYEDQFRVYYEYAIREEDSFAGLESYVYGNLIEMEILLSETSECYRDAPINKLSLFTRYDTLIHGGVLGEMRTERFTYGLNFLLNGGSLLMIDHEYWTFENAPAVNILGMRWTAAF